MKDFKIADIYPFRVRDRQFLFSPTNCSVWEVEPEAQEILDFMMRPSDHSMDLITDEGVLEILEELEKKGVIYTADSYTEMDRPPLSYNPFTLKTLVLYISSDCNLNCTYCYGKGDSKGLMDEQVALKGVDFILNHSGRNQPVTIVFFGGEPLLNFKVMKFVVDYAKKQSPKMGKEIDFTITTNGTLLSKEIINFLSHHKIGVTISIDGPKDTNDRYRVFPNKEGSYETISHGVQELIQVYRERPVTARVTLTKDLSNITEILSHLLSLGFYEVGFSPVTSSDPQLQLSEGDMDRLLQEFSSLSQNFTGNAVKDRYLGFSNLSNLLAELHYGLTRPYPCGAGFGLLSVDHLGYLYLCHRFVGRKEFILGDIFSGIDHHKRVELLQNAHKKSYHDDCRKCFLRNLCRGGCYYESFIHDGDIGVINGHYCRWLRQWYDNGLKVYVTILNENPSFIKEHIERRRM